MSKWGSLEDSFKSIDGEAIFNEERNEHFNSESLGSGETSGDYNKYIADWSPGFKTVLSSYDDPMVVQEQELCDEILNLLDRYLAYLEKSKTANEITPDEYTSTKSNIYSSIYKTNSIKQTASGKLSTIESLKNLRKMINKSIAQFEQHFASLKQVGESR